MPTYLTPGVYVEEVPSRDQADRGCRHLGRGVRRARARRPGQHADADLELDPVRAIFGDPANPDDGPFMEGAYLAHAVYGFFQNGGTSAGSSASARRGRRARARRPRCPRPATRASRRCGRSRARTSRARSTVELTEEPGRRRRTARPATTDLQGRGHRGRGARGVRGPDAQEGPHERRDEGQRASKFVKIEETGAALPDAQRAPAAGKYSLSPAGRRRGDRRRRLRGRRRQAHRHGRPGRDRRGHDGLHPRPDDARRQRRRRPVRDLQGKMIAHCENAGRPHGDPRLAARTCSRRRSSSGA